LHLRNNKHIRICLRSWPHHTQRANKQATDRYPQAKQAIMSSLVVNLARKVTTTSVLSLVNCPVVGKKAVAKHALPRGAVLNVFKTPVLTYPTMHTVQLTTDVHVAPTDGAECISHQCGPDTNSAVVVADDFKSAAFVTTRDVAEGEEMTFNVSN
jgi:hypothetical protein